MSVYAHGFDYLSTAELAEYWDTTAGGPALNATAARDGVQGLQVTGGHGEVNKVYFPSGQNQMWAGISFQYVGTPNTGSANILMFTNTTPGTGGQCAVGVNATGHIEVSQADRGTVIATSTLALSAGQWYSIEARAKLLGGSSDEMEVRVDDGTGPVTWLNVTGSFKWQATTDLAGIRVGNGAGGGSPDYRYDNLYVSDEGFKGDLRVTTLYPNGAGSNAGWTTQVGGTGGTPYTAVNETPNDGDTSYLLTATLSALHTLAMQDLGITPPSITFVQAVACLRQETAVTMTVAPVMLSSATPKIGAFASPGTTYKYEHVSSTVDPSTLAPWTLAGVNAVECGMKAGPANAGNVRCTQVVLEVQYPNPLGSTSGGAVAFARMDG